MSEPKTEKLSVKKNQKSSDCEINEATLVELRRIFSKYSIAFLANDKTSLLFLKKDCERLGITDIIEFSKGQDLINFCRSGHVDVIFSLKDIRDMHWVTFIRMLRTEADIPFIATVLFMSEVSDSAILSKEDRQNLQLAASYEIEIRNGVTLGIKKLYNLLAKIINSSKNANSISNKLAKAKEHFRNGLIDQARKIYLELDKDEKGNLAVKSGLCESSKEHPKIYMEKLTEILNTDPKNYNIKFKLLTRMVEEKQVTAATSLFNETFKELTTSNESFWLTHLGEICANNKIDIFVNKIVAFLQTKSDLSWRPFYLRAKQSLAKADLVKAKAFILEAIKRGHKDQPEFFNMLGIIEKRSGNLSEALKHFETAYGYLANDPRVPYNIALVYSGMGDNENCKKYLNLSLALAPTYDRAKQMLVRLDKKILLPTA